MGRKGKELKKIIVTVMAALLLLPTLSCSLLSQTGTEVWPEPPAAGTTLEVITTYSGLHRNTLIFENYYAAWEEETGHQVINLSAVSDDLFKVRIQKDFETGSEPDVLFFFLGADANPFIESGRVVSLEEIRAEYPDYAGNMDDSRIPGSLVDGKAYGVPVNGFWEALFINTEVLTKAGVALPGSNYTWEQFINDCRVIRDAGYVPVAAALGHIPHYWWEYTIYNHTTPETHLKIPESTEDEQGRAWLAGMRDITEMYQAGFFPKNTLTETDDETFAMFMDGQAAFLLDGSWKVGNIVAACQTDPDDPDTLEEEKLGKYDVTFVPAREGRKASDLIGGMSMGYYITRKAWNDPQKRAAAVSFVQHMTRDEVVRDFALHTATALKNEAEAGEEAAHASLQNKAVEMTSQVTSFTGAVQDLFQGECRTPIFDGLPEIVSGYADAADALQEGLDIYAAQR